MTSNRLQIQSFAGTHQWSIRHSCGRLFLRLGRACLGVVPLRPFALDCDCSPAARGLDL